MGKQLQQLFDELVSHPEEWVTQWFNDYIQFTEEIKVIRFRLEKPRSRLSDDRLYEGLKSFEKLTYSGFVYKLVCELKNGIAGRGQSVLSNAHLSEFLKNKEFEMFLQRIITKPLNNELFCEFNEWWSQQPGVKHNRVLINRIFAACASAEISTIVDEGKFNKLFAWLQKEDLIDRYALNSDRDNWLVRNIFMIKELHHVKRGGILGEWISIFPWLLFEHMETMGSTSLPTTEAPTPHARQLPRNLILYGPPGTGKTYNTVNHSLAICEGRSVLSYEDEDRTELMQRFSQLRAAGKIIFTTFHQSMSYEDFVEGIKPVTANGHISYKVVAGIFREICDRARQNYFQKISKNSAGSFEELWYQFISPLKREGEGRVRVNMRRDYFTIIGVDDRNVFFEKKDGSRNHDLSLKTLKRFYEDPDSMGVIDGLKVYYKPLVDELNNRLKLRDPDTPVAQKEGPSDFVLVIDEINRGNVAAILGELITLLEPDKRLGMENALQVMLPYSQDSDFGVPPNLHIIGTMNTADRSVEALDAALRRRFTFEEMMPDPGLLNEVGGVDLKRMLESINLRLEVLVGRDHTIGHAFFMQIQTLDDLKQVFHSKVIPQLQEYFYGDWAKINLILGNSFVKRNVEANRISWPKGVGVPDEVEGRELWEITKRSEWNLTAFQSIYSVR